MLTIHKDINIISVGQRPVINLSQYDDDFQIVFNLYASSGAFTIPSGTTAQIQGTKTDGNGYSAGASVSGNTVTVAGHVQMTAAAGPNVYEIALFNNGKRLSTINFILMVERAALDSDTVSSESVIKDLSNIPAAVQQAEDAADRAEEAARTLTIDPTLTQSGQAADAKITGDEINDLKSDFEQFEGISDEVKQALLGCFAKVAWIDEHGQDYYDTLESALYPSEYPRIVAVFNSGQDTIYTDDTLDSLKQYLTVTYFETEESTGTVVPSTNYTLSGTLSEGASTITVTYNYLHTTFIVTAVDFYNIQEWTTSGLLQTTQGNIIDSNLPDLYTNPGNTKRAIAVVSRGKAGFYDYNTSQVFNPEIYPIPVPVGATAISVSCPQEVRPGIIIWNYSNGGYSNSGQASGWLGYGGGTFSLSAQSTDLFATVQFEAGGAVLSGVPNPVSVTYIV